MLDSVIRGVNGTGVTVDRAQTCFFSGHRVIAEADLAPLLSLLDRELESLYYAGYTTFLCGAARGYDLLAASAVLRLKRMHPDAELRLVCLIPCAGQEQRWNKGEQELYRAILKLSEVVLLQEQYDKNCMRSRNRMLVTHASVGVVYRMPSRRMSGTGMTVHMAETAGIPVHNLYTILHAPTEPGADTGAL